MTTPRRPEAPTIFTPAVYANLINYIRQMLLQPNVDWNDINQRICNLSQHTVGDWLAQQTVVWIYKTYDAKGIERGYRMYDTNPELIGMPCPPEQVGYFVCPTPIAKPKCEHKKVYIYDLTLGNQAFRCRDCDKTVVPADGWKAEGG